MSDGSEIVLPIRLSSEQAEQMWQNLGKRFPGNPIPPTPLPPPPKETEQGFDSLLKKLTDFRREQVQQGRQAKFLANELLDLVPAASGAKGHLQGLAGVLIEGAAGGLTFGLAMEAGKFAVALFTEGIERSTKKAEEQRKYVKDLQLAYIDARVSWEQFVASLGTEHQGEAEKKRSQDLLSKKKDTATALLELREAQEELRYLQEHAAEASQIQLHGIGFFDGGGLMGGGWAQEAQDRVAAAKKALDILYAGMAGTEQNYQKDRAVIWDKGQEAVNKITQGRMLEGLSERLKIDKAYAQAKADLDKDTKGGKYAPEQAYVLEQTLEVEHTRKLAALKVKQGDELRAIELSTAKLLMSDRQKIEADGNEEIRKIREQADLARTAGDTGEADRLGRIILAKKQLLGATLADFDAKQAIAQRQRDADEDTGRVAAEIARRRDGIAEIEALEAAGWHKETAAKLQALTAEHQAEEIKLDSWKADGLVSEEQYQAAKTEIHRRYAKNREDILRKESAVETFINSQKQAVLQSFANSVGAQVGRIAGFSLAYERALHASGKASALSFGDMAAAAAKWAQDTVASIAAAATVEAVMELARGYAALADPLTAGKAPMHFAAAATFGEIAGIATAAGLAIGMVRPMTADEKASASGATNTDTGALSAAGQTPTTGTRESGTQAAASGQVIRETTIIVAGDPFESPAETARRAARRLEEAKRLDLLRRAN